MRSNAYSPTDWESCIEISRREIAEGKGIPNDVVFDRLHAKLLKMKEQETAKCR